MIMNYKTSTRRVARILALFLSASLSLAGGVQASLPPSAGGKLAHGLSYQHEDIAEGPWSIHVVKVERNNPEFEVQSTLARGNRFGLATLSEQIRALPPDLGKPVAGINGDFFRRQEPYLGDPKGLQIIRGELVSAPTDWTCLWIDPQGSPHMTNVLSRLQVFWPSGQKTPFGLNEPRPKSGAVLYTPVVGPTTRTSGGRELVLEQSGTNAWLPLKPGMIYSARVREVRDSGNSPIAAGTMVLSLARPLVSSLPAVAPGAVLQFSTATWPELKGVPTAIGGGPAIVRDGKVVEGIENRVRHPRAAVGWNKDFIFLVEVDGRQRDLSVGMTLRELGKYLVKIGVTDAMNLDGGGSATCWVYGQVMNSPSEGEERGMGNGLVIVHKEKKASSSTTQ